MQIDMLMCLTKLNHGLPSLAIFLEVWDHMQKLGNVITNLTSRDKVIVKWHAELEAGPLCLQDQLDHWKGLLFDQLPNGPTFL